MEKQPLHGIQKMERLLFVCCGIFMLIVLTLSAREHNIVQNDREKGTYTIVENAVFEQKEEETAPIGVVNEYRFRLEEVTRADTLVFFINHHDVEVFLDGVCVSRVEENGKLFQTSGNLWFMIPLQNNDSGKEVCVRLYPLYEDYQDKQVTFMLGSELAIYQEIFYAAVPELVLSICVILAGLFLFSVAFHYMFKGVTVEWLYAVSVLAVFSGIWRVTYGKFIYFKFQEHTVFFYTLSVISLMLVALSMLNCVEIHGDEKQRTFICCCSNVYGALYTGQLVLQMFGICDLRQCLNLIHATLIFSAIVLFSNGILAWSKKGNSAGLVFGRNYSWILSIGVLVDLLLYYIAKTSTGMLFTLGAILVYALLESVRLLLYFMEQKNVLEEMEIKLKMSRTTTMMSQIRSHFVFNILNAISGLCKYDPEKADDTVVRFARYLRNNIDIMEDDKNIPFKTDLRQLEDYVILEQVRFGDKIEFYTDIEADDFMIPPLILQPVVENAIKHGVSKKMGNGMIILRTRKDGDNVVITVEDDGVGFDMEELDKEKSVGIRNVRFRLEHLVNGTMEIQSQVGVGTTVTITIPQKGNGT